MYLVRGDRAPEVQSLCHAAFPGTAAGGLGRRMARSLHPAALHLHTSGPNKAGTLLHIGRRANRGGGGVQGVWGQVSLPFKGGWGQGRVAWHCGPWDP